MTFCYFFCNPNATILKLYSSKKNFEVVFLHVVLEIFLALAMGKSCPLLDYDILCSMWPTSEVVSSLNQISVRCLKYDLDKLQQVKYSPHWGTVTEHKHPSPLPPPSPIFLQTAEFKVISIYGYDMLFIERNIKSPAKQRQTFKLSMTTILSYHIDERNGTLTTQCRIYNTTHLHFLSPIYIISRKQKNKGIGMQNRSTDDGSMFGILIVRFLCRLSAVNERNVLIMVTTELEEHRQFQLSLTHLVSSYSCSNLLWTYVIFYKYSAVVFFSVLYIDVCGCTRSVIVCIGW